MNKDDKLSSRKKAALNSGQNVVKIISADSKLQMMWLPWLPNRDDGLLRRWLSREWWKELMKKDDEELNCSPSRLWAEDDFLWGCWDVVAIVTHRRWKKANSEGELAENELSCDPNRRWTGEWAQLIGSCLRISLDVVVMVTKWSWRFTGSSVEPRMMRKKRGMQKLAKNDEEGWWWDELKSKPPERSWTAFEVAKLVDVLIGHLRGIRFQVDAWMVVPLDSTPNIIILIIPTILTISIILIILIMISIFLTIEEWRRIIHSFEHLG